MNTITERYFYDWQKFPIFGKYFAQIISPKNPNLNRQITSIGIIIFILGLTYLPVFSKGNNLTLTVVIGSELKEALTEIETEFEQLYPQINLDLKIQGSQDIINNVIDEKNDFKPAVLIPANGQLIEELETRLKTQGKTAIFSNQPQAIAKTVLVAIAWEERGNVLFPQGKFNWQQIETGLQKKRWEKLGGKPEWGSFDLIMTDPNRSNSGQLTLSLWVKNQLKRDFLTVTDLNNNEVDRLFNLIKNSLYQPPRSTDILLQEFIAKGSNDADVAIVYESIALYRWLETKQTKNQTYQIYYPLPTIQTTVTGVILKDEIDKATAKAAQNFLDFLKTEEQQKIFAKYGFRPITNLDLSTLLDTPWNQNIPGVEIQLPSQLQDPSNSEVMNEIRKIWNRS
jgi:ABC-type molybdate transport system substrate-binding protein